MNKLITTYERITPVQATSELERNSKHQRQTHHYLVNRYATMMREGSWLDFAPDPILYDAKDHLFNGQHRYQAVVLSGVTVGFWIIRNCPREMQFVIDQGRPRTFADLLQVYTGVQTPARLGAVLRVLLSGYQGLFHSSSLSHTRSGPQVRDLYERIKPQLDEVRGWCTQYQKTYYVRTVTIEAVLARALIARAAPASRLRLFLHILCTGEYESLETDRAGLTCRNYLIDIAAKDYRHFSGWAGQRMRYAYTEAALRAFIDKRKAERIIEADEELFPLPFDLDPVRLSPPSPTNAVAEPTEREDTTRRGAKQKITGRKLQRAQALLTEGVPMAQVAKRLKVARSTLYVSLARTGGQNGVAGPQHTEDQLNA